MYIACPKCDWHPDGHARWQCSCQHVWDTFATHGVCPACNRVWKETQCLACQAWSDHEDWYHDDDDLSVEEYLAQPERLIQPVSPTTTEGLNHDEPFCRR